MSDLGQNLRQELKQEVQEEERQKKDSLKNVEKHIENVLQSSMYKEFIEEITNTFVELTSKNIKDYVISKIKDYVISGERYYSDVFELNATCTSWNMAINKEILKAYSELNSLERTNKQKKYWKLVNLFPDIRYEISDNENLQTDSQMLMAKVSWGISQTPGPFTGLFGRWQVSIHTQKLLDKLIDELKKYDVKTKLLALKSYDYDSQIRREDKHWYEQKQGETTINHFTYSEYKTRKIKTFAKYQNCKYYKEHYFAYKIILLQVKFYY